jgi:type IX secretion system PorP/SprF family membrane protein
MKKLFFTLAFVAAFLLNAQDIHFTQYGFSPLNTNPASTGFFDGDYRLGGIFRNQWSAVPVPYNTASFFGDMRLGQNKLASDRVGVGFLFNNDVSGDSKYGTTQIYVPLAYQKKMNADSTLIVSVGLQPGISSTGFKTAALTFDSQYDGSQYNGALPSQENFAVTNQTKFDLNAGVLSQYTFMQRGYVLAGVSAYHLTVPSVTYFNNKASKLDFKTNVYALLNYPLAPVFDVNIELLYSMQGQYRELVSGVNAKFIFPVKHHQAVFAGAYLRPKDAFIARVGMEFKSWQFTMAYDVNTSGFKAATNRKGAMEFGLIYIFKKIIPFIPKKRVCPVYM